MKVLPVVLRRVASDDVDDAIDHLLSEGSIQATEAFVEDLERALTHLARHPRTGSPRFAHELRLPGLRAWPLARFPYQVFYVDHSDRLDVWRVLHTSRDVPAWLQAPDVP